MPSTFRFSAVDRLIFGPGCVETGLASTCKQLNLQRVFVLGTPSLQRNGQVESVCRELGKQFAGSFTDAMAHTPRQVVLTAARLATDAQADGIVCVGGGSVVDLAKGVAIAVAEGPDFNAHKVAFSTERGLRIPKLNQQKLPIIAIPTTLSGSEFTSGAGITDEATGEKEMYVDSKITPRVVFHDAALAIETPTHLWSETGMKAAGDCMEFYVSRRSNPIVEALSLGALRLLLENLPLAREADSVDARQNCLHAVFLVMSSSGSAGAGLVAGLRHQLGAYLGIPHGVASTIVLPHVLRWNEAHVGSKYDDMAQHLGLPEIAAKEGSLIRFVCDLVEELALPTRLSQVGVQRESLPTIAEQTMRDFVIANNPRPVQQVEEILEVLESAH